MRITVGSIAYLDAANVGHGIGSDPDGYRIEFIGSWTALAPLQARLESEELVEVDVDDWQVVTVNGELRALTREEMADRAALLVHLSTWTRPA